MIFLTELANFATFATDSNFSRLDVILLVSFVAFVYIMGRFENKTEGERVVDFCCQEKNVAIKRKFSTYDELPEFENSVPLDREKEIGFVRLEKVISAKEVADEIVKGLSPRLNGATLMKGERHRDAFERVFHKNASDDGWREKGANAVRVILAVDKVKDETGSDFKLAIASVVVSDWLTSVMISVRWSCWSLNRFTESRNDKKRNEAIVAAESDDLFDDTNCASPIIANAPEEKAEQLARQALKTVLNLVERIDKNKIKRTVKNFRFDRRNDDSYVGITISSFMRQDKRGASRPRDADSFRDFVDVNFARSNRALDSDSSPQKGAFI